MKDRITGVAEPLNEQSSGKMFIITSVCNQAPDIHDMTITEPVAEQDQNNTPKKYAVDKWYKSILETMTTDLDRKVRTLNKLCDDLREVEECIDNLDKDTYMDEVVSAILTGYISNQKNKYLLEHIK